MGREEPHCCNPNRTRVTTILISLGLNSPFLVEPREVRLFTQYPVIPRHKEVGFSDVAFLSPFHCSGPTTGFLKSCPRNSGASQSGAASARRLGEQERGQRWSQQALRCLPRLPSAVLGNGTPFAPGFRPKSSILHSRPI